MARALRLEGEEAVYHVIVRGNEREALVRDDEDRPGREGMGSVLIPCITEEKGVVGFPRGAELMSGAGRSPVPARWPEPRLVLTFRHGSGA
jgi:hypothetical protein